MQRSLYEHWFLNRLCELKGRVSLWLQSFMRVCKLWSNGSEIGCHAHAPKEAGWVGGISEHDHSFIYPITINNAFCDYVAAIILFIGKGWFTSWSCSLGSHFPNAALKGCRSWYEQKCGGKKKPNLTRTDPSNRSFIKNFPGTLQRAKISSASGKEQRKNYNPFFEQSSKLLYWGEQRMDVRLRSRWRVLAPVIRSPRWDVGYMCYPT